MNFAMTFTNACKLVKGDVLVHIDVSTNQHFQFPEGTGKLPALRTQNSCIDVEYATDSNEALIVSAVTSPSLATSEARWVLQKHLWSKLSSFDAETIKFHCYEDTPINRQAVADGIANLSSFDFSAWSTNAECINVFSNSRDQEDLRNNFGFRQWINLNPDELTSITIGEKMRAFCEKEDHCTFESLTDNQLKEERMNLLLAVGHGSQKSPPRLHYAIYNPNGSNLSDGLFLVGKGITFDTGGINLKPYESHVNTMKNDMGGAGLMWHVFKGLVKSQFPHPICLAIPSCENAIDQDSIQPGSIIEGHHGTKVIIEHTDAEGRLILADALSYTNAKYKPKRIYTAATLTGGSLKQFSNFYTPVHFSNKSEQESMSKTGEEHGEEFTFWPHRQWFKNANRHKAADLTNLGRMPGHAVGSGSSNVAAHFLQCFSECPIVHFDIFCSTWNWSSDYPGHTYGASGAPYASLLHYFRNQWGS